MAAASDAPTVVVVSLAGVRSDDDVPLAIAAALGINEATPGGASPTPAPGPTCGCGSSRCREQPTLLVLDNCEQVIDGVAGWVADILAAVPTLRVLTTSRTPLAVAGEVTYPLPPLSVDGAEARDGADAGGPADTGDEASTAGEIESPAVRLFLDRARAVRPGATLPKDVITRLCTHLDGLPLAIELAAARVRTMTPEQIEARLQDRFALLTTGDRTAPERHRTLEAVIGWSWDLLDQQARRAMAMLAVLPAGFTVETMATVLGEPADDVVDRLVSQSLLLVGERPDTGQVRFRMLETVREYALARLADTPGGVEDAWARVTDWACRFSTDRLGQVFEREVNRQVRAEHDNLISVLRRSIDADDDAVTVLLFALLGQGWMVQGAFTELAAFAPVVFDAVARTGEREVPVDALIVTLIFGAFVLRAEGEPRALRFLARIRILRRRHPDMDSLLGAFADAVLAILQAGASRRTDRILAAFERLRAAPDLATRLLGESLLSQFAENSGDMHTALESATRAWQLANATRHSGSPRWRRPRSPS
ncbi:ATP-binding protein [Microbacterium elymi]|uniref:Winged helix-turn-helix domain-containing protein n=1 Tax=Microbacterium elymi TaxID=2909587 RepID=A0ABY5NLA8_9MICO|nr:hypothetical protein [Microbacterium elymi]UUT35933.1 hypothetical protein L2X98_22600 [Microbacterium elymi]